MNAEEELLDIVDEQDQVIGKEKRKIVHQKGHIHRALSVIVLNSKNQILLQQRSPKRTISPLAWDLSTSEHVLAGESYEDAAKRSLKEELGIEGEVQRLRETILQKRKYELDEITIIENEQTGLFYTENEGPFNIDKEEVEQVKFFTIDEIDQMVKKGEKFTVWFLEEWESTKLRLQKR